MPTTIRSTAPDAYIIFFPYASDRTEIGKAYKPSDISTKKSPVFVRTDLISVNTSKSKGGAGSWSATLSPRINYNEVIDPGTWCMIFMSDEDLTLTEQSDANSGPESGLKMLGIVRSVRVIESIDPNSGTRNKRFEIAGDDFHTVLDAQVYINPELRPKGDAKASPIIDSFAYFKRPMEGEMNPGQMVEFLIQTMLGKKEGLGSNILDGGGGKAGGVYGIPPEVAKRLQGNKADGNLFVNLMQFNIQENLYGLITHQPSLGTLYTLWSMIESFSNKVLNEVYTDLMPKRINGQARLVPTIVHRCIPFTSHQFVSNAPTLCISKSANKRSDSKTQLYTSRFVGEDEIFAMNYGKSDHERFNFFFVANNFSNEHGLSAWTMATLLGEGESQNPLGDSASIARHGLRPYLASSNYMQLQEDHFVASNEIARDMWHKAHLYHNGQVSLVGTKEHIPVGTNIQFKDRNWIAQVEQVQHSYAVAPSGHKSFRTNIAFVRLQTIKGSPIDDGNGSGEESYDHNITGSNGDKQ